MRSITTMSTHRKGDVMKKTTKKPALIRKVIKKIKPKKSKDSYAY